MDWISMASGFVVSGAQSTNSSLESSEYYITFVGHKKQKESIEG